MRAYRVRGAISIEHVLLLIAIAFAGGLMIKSSGIDGRVRNASSVFAGKAKPDPAAKNQSTN